jgi:hypothetical protein
LNEQVVGGSNWVGQVVENIGREWIGPRGKIGLNEYIRGNSNDEYVRDRKLGVLRAQHDQLQQCRIFKSDEKESQKVS